MTPASEDLKRLIQIAEENTIQCLNQAYATRRGVRLLTDELKFIRRLKDEASKRT